MKVQARVNGGVADAFSEFAKQNGMNASEATRDLIRRALEQLGYYSVTKATNERQPATA